MTRTAPRLPVLGGLVALFTLVLGSTAYAQDDTTEVVGDGDVLSVNAFTLSVIVGLIVPLVNGIALKPTVPSWVKGVVNLVLSYVGNVIALSMQEDGSAIFSREVIVTTAFAFAVALATYAGIFKPVGLTNNPANPTGRASLGTGGIG